MNGIIIDFQTINDRLQSDTGRESSRYYYTIVLPWDVGTLMWRRTRVKANVGKQTSLICVIPHGVKIPGGIRSKGCHS